MLFCKRKRKFIKKLVAVLSIVAILGVSAFVAGSAFISYDQTLMMAGGGDEWSGG